MLLTEFDAKKFYREVRKDGYEDGMERGREEMICSMFEAGLSLTKIAEIAKCSEEEIKTIVILH